MAAGYISANYLLQYSNFCYSDYGALFQHSYLFMTIAIASASDNQN